MTRGTTADLSIDLHGVPMSEIVSLYVTIRQGDVIVERTLDEVKIIGHTICISLSQEDTLRFRGNREARIQVRGVLESGRVFASDISRTMVRPILKEGVIE